MDNNKPKEITIILETGDFTVRNYISNKGVYL